MDRSRALAIVALFAATLSLRAADAAAAEPKSLLEAPEPLAEALRSRLGKDFRIRSLNLRNDGAEVEIQDSAIPANLDEYSFADGVLSAPEPIQAGRNQKELNASLFPFGDVDLSILKPLLADAQKRAKAESARVIDVRIKRVTGGEYDTWGSPRIFVTVNGPRAGAVVEYSLDGKHKDTTRW